MRTEEKPTCRDVQSAANDDELPQCSQSGGVFHLEESSTFSDREGKLFYSRSVGSDGSICRKWHRTLDLFVQVGVCTSGQQRWAGRIQREREKTSAVAVVCRGPRGLSD